MANRLEIRISAIADNLSGLNAVGKAIAQTKNDLQGLDELSRQYTQTGQRQIAVAAGLAGILAATVKPAAQFDQGLRNVNSIAKLNEEQFKALRSAVLDISRDPQVTDMPAQLARGLYDIYSSGIEGSAGLDVLKIASKGAAAGLSETSTASRVLTAVMNGYNRKTGQDAADIMDVLFKTVDRGVVTFDELAAYFANVSTTAASANVSLEEVAAGMMTMTKQGHDAATAATSLNRIILSFLNPSKEMTEMLKRSGYESGIAVLQQRGLAGAVEWLTQATGGNVDVLVSMLGEVRAVRAAMALTGKGAQMFAEDLVAAKNHAGAMDAALKEQAKGGLFEWKLILKDLTIAATEFGDTVLPMLRQVSGGIREAAAWFGQLPEPVRKAIVASIGLSAATYGIKGAVNLARGGILQHVIALLQMGKAQEIAAEEGVAGIGILGRFGKATLGAKGRWLQWISAVNKGQVFGAIRKGADIARGAIDKLALMGQVKRIQMFDDPRLFERSLKPLLEMRRWNWAAQWAETNKHIGGYVKWIGKAGKDTVSSGLLSTRWSLGVGRLAGAWKNVGLAVMGAKAWLLQLPGLIRTVGLSLVKFLMSPVGIVIIALAGLTYELYKLIGAYKEMRAAQEQARQAKNQQEQADKEAGVIRDKDGAIISIANPTRLRPHPEQTKASATLAVAGSGTAAATTGPVVVAAAGSTGTAPAGYGAVLAGAQNGQYSADQLTSLMLPFQGGDYKISDADLNKLVDSAETEAAGTGGTPTVTTKGDGSVVLNLSITVSSKEEAVRVVQRELEKAFAR